jgi:hypothetical protein
MVSTNFFEFLLGVVLGRRVAIQNLKSGRLHEGMKQDEMGEGCSCCKLEGPGKVFLRR